MLERITQLRDEAVAAVAAATSAADLEEARVRWLGRKSELTSILRGIAELPAEERGPVGKAANEARVALESAIEQRGADLDAAELTERLREDRVDVTLPGTPPRETGRLHLITRTRRLIEDVMVGLGYQVAEGPEIEHDYYNFTALNHPPGHPARMVQDTFYLDPAAIAAAAGAEDIVLRTHTSPMQVRAMEAQPPPIFIIVPGKVYRRDSDATHSPMFHQIEGLAIGEDITLADLQGTLREMLRAVFGAEREARMRPHFFPFTEPSVEFDVSCFRCEGTGEVITAASPPDQPLPGQTGPGPGTSARCNLCKGSGWIEVGGAGMVDPNVLGFVEGNGYDPERVQGFAFGMGVERIAMLRHGVPDLRRFFDNDVRVLEQFR